MGVTRKKFEVERNTLQEKRARGRPRKTQFIKVISTMDYIKKVEKLQMEGNMAENWRIFKQNFEIFCIAAELDKKSDPVKVAVLLNAVGPEAVEVFNSFNIEEEKKKSLWRRH